LHPDRFGQILRCLVCKNDPVPTFPDEKAAINHMVVIHDWILGPDGPQPPILRSPGKL
jgi:hypothetical protein